MGIPAIPARIKRAREIGVAAAIAATTFFSGSAQSAPLDISDVPLFLQESVAPLNLLVLGRDHKLYYEAYNDHSDLDGKPDANGKPTLEIGYRPDKIEYFGYFDSYKCYTYGSEVFTPTRRTNLDVNGVRTKKCGGADEWSGDWLNYVTTARIDAMRKVLYGGKRSTDSTSKTILERSHIPQDAHSWGKEYVSVANDGYDIRDYTPYSVPTSGRHLFANATLMLDDTAAQNWSRPPLLRVALNQGVRIWNWVSVESPVAGICVNDGRCTKIGGLPSSDSGSGTRITIEDKVVRVEVCKGTDADPATTLHEKNCRAYGTSFKPIGLLQEYGENDAMLFGLLTGSYQLSKNGGVLRKNMGSIADEIDPADGTLTATVGIIRTLDRLKATGFEDYRGNVWYDTAGRGAGATYLPGLKTDGPFGNGQFGGMWGNPVAEMMYEGLRYFAGKSAATSQFSYTDAGSFDNALGLPLVSTWQNPYASGKPECAKPFELVMSDVNTSYDSDHLPGSAYASTVSDALSGLDVGALADSIWSNEKDLKGSREVFIGQSTATNYDGSPDPKPADSFKYLRGLAPEEPTKQGSYYAASVASFGYSNDINPESTDYPQKVQTFAVALASPLPRIDVKTQSGKTVTIVPFGKSVGGNSIDAAQGGFQPTNQIVDFYVESYSDTSGVFQVNFEDVEAGNDHDMDAIVRYTYSVSGEVVTVSVSSDYAAGGIIQHMGYVISGTGATTDGIYLVVRDSDTAAASDVPYFLDTPPGVLPGGCKSPLICTRPAPSLGLGLADTRTFTADNSTNATLLQDPLWYAAKWGGFKDKDGDNRPDDAVKDGSGKILTPAEWDANNDSNPDNYFLVTNALNLGDQLRKAFQEILDNAGSASSASVNSGSISSDTRIYQATFDYDEDGNWGGELLAYKVDPTNGKITDEAWRASAKMPDYDARAIITTNPDGTGVPFRWTDDLDDARKTAIAPDFNTSAAAKAAAENRLKYLRGDISNEHVSETDGKPYRQRPSKLGDIVASSPIYVGGPPFFYRDNLEDEDKPYSAFKKTNQTRTPMVYAGANDGMLHAFNANTGVEKFAFIPSTAYRYLTTLADLDYAHKYFVDAPPNMGDAFFGEMGEWQTVLVGGLNRGGQGIYALNITDPSKFTEGNAKDVLLWEFTDADHADMGYSYSQPAVVRLQNGKWGAIFGNGYNNTEADGIVSTTGNAVLYIVDVESGELIASIDTGQGTADNADNRPNGLSTPAVVDSNGDMKVDYVYAGDLLGNMWKFDIRNTDDTKWKVAYVDGSGNPAPLFKAVDPVRSTVRQPITSRPEVIRGPQGLGLMVLFGTGQYLETSDKVVLQNDKKIQAYYGLLDKNTGADSDVIAGLGELTEQTIDVEGTFDYLDAATSKTISRKVRFTSANPIGAGDKGWYMNLLSADSNLASSYQGERQVSNTAVRAGRVIFTTLIPNADPCGAGGTSWLMELDALTGKRLNTTPLDINNDGVIDEEDVTQILQNGTNTTNPPSGLDIGVGITPEPGILFGDGGNKEYKYNPGTTGKIGMTVEDPGPRVRGRQSWRQVR